MLATFWLQCGALGMDCTFLTQADTIAAVVSHSMTRLALVELVCTRGAKISCNSVVAMGSNSCCLSPVTCGEVGLVFRHVCAFSNTHCDDNALICCAAQSTSDVLILLRQVNNSLKQHDKQSLQLTEHLMAESRAKKVGC